jgi:hypothetical protein
MAERRDRVANATKKYRFIGSHAEILANGRPVEPGEFVELSDEEIREPQNETLAADGLLVGLDDAAEHERKLAERRISDRGNKPEGEES